MLASDYVCPCTVRSKNARNPGLLPEHFLPPARQRALRWSSNGRATSTANATTYVRLLLPVLSQSLLQWGQTDQHQASMCGMSLGNHGFRVWGRLLHNSFQCSKYQSSQCCYCVDCHYLVTIDIIIRIDISDHDHQTGRARGRHSSLASQAGHDQADRAEDTHLPGQLGLQALALMCLPFLRRKHTEPFGKKSRQQSHIGTMHMR